MAWVPSDYAPQDPILSLAFTREQVAFEQAPTWLVNRCNAVAYGDMWILAEAKRPEGIYLLENGSIWLQPDEDGTHRAALEPFGSGSIDLLTPSGRCVPKWDPDNAFGAFFPDHPGAKATPAELSIVHDLGVDMLRRDLRIFGGKARFFKALAATGHGIADQDPLMIPLLEQLQKDGRI
jgi:hypothetical protein